MNWLQKIPDGASLCVIVGHDFTDKVWARKKSASVSLLHTQVCLSGATNGATKGNNLMWMPNLQPYKRSLKDRKLRPDSPFTVHQPPLLLLQMNLVHFSDVKLVPVERREPEAQSGKTDQNMALLTKSFLSALLHY